MANRKHQNNFGTNLTSNQIAGVTTTPLNSIPSVAAPFTIALDSTNLNGKYEVVEVSSKTATNILHPATTYAHTTAEEVRMVVGATELDEFAEAANDAGGGWQSVSAAWTYASADAPTFTITVPSGAASIYGVGDRIQLTQTTAKYFIITVVADTVLTVYGGTDYVLANAAISAISYSHNKSPLGFPLDPTKWTVITTDVTARAQASPVSGTWYNLGSITQSIPIGVWQTSYQVSVAGDDASGTIIIDYRVTLSTANNSESDVDFSSRGYQFVNSAVSGTTADTFFRQKTLVLASKTSYYINTQVSGTAPSVNVTNPNDVSKLIIRSICAYL